MRRRVVREVGTTIAGVAVILTGLIFGNNFLQRSSLAEQMTQWRQNLEKAQRVSLMKWPLLQKTRGGYFSGPTFAEELKQYDGQQINLMGFQVPLEQFREMNEFLLLPMPIECYFCQSPPMKDVVLVRMGQGETVRLYKEPILLSGTLTLHEGPKSQFFYTITDAQWNKPGADIKMHTRNVKLQHQIESKKQKQEPMMEGSPVPQAASADDVIKNASAPPDAAAPTAPTADGSAAAPAPSAPTEGGGAPPPSQ